MTDAEDEWIVINGMGGYVCAECGMPVESEPCEAHQPTKYARAHGTLRVPVSMFERVDGCFACENRTGLPIPVSEFPEGGDIGLCMRHWNWWITHFANIAPDHETPEPPCSARLLESEIARERAALRPGSAEWVTAPDGEEFRVGQCQGHAACPVERHEHGCYADDGTNCDHPDEHPRPGGSE